MLQVPIKEVNSISSIDLNGRHEYFIKKIADQQELVILINQDKTLFFDAQDGNVLIHFWSRVEYSEAFLQANNLKLEVSEVDFDYLGENIFPEIKSKGALVSVMPVKERFGHVLELSAFSDDLKTYLDEWY